MLLAKPMRPPSPLCTGDRVRNTQTLLIRSRWGHTVDPGRVDGVCGEECALAVKRAKFQLGFMLSNVDGRCTNDLRSLLLAATDPEAKALGPLRWVRRRYWLRKAAQPPIR